MGKRKKRFSSAQIIVVSILLLLGIYVITSDLEKTSTIRSSSNPTPSKIYPKEIISCTSISDTKKLCEFSEFPFKFTHPNNLVLENSPSENNTIYLKSNDKEVIRISPSQHGVGYGEAKLSQIPFYKEDGKLLTISPKQIYKLRSYLEGEEVPTKGRYHSFIWYPNTSLDPIMFSCMIDEERICDEIVESIQFTQ